MPATLTSACGLIALLFFLNRIIPRYHPAESYLGSLEMDLVLSGPRLAQAAFADFRKSRRLAQLDLAACASVLALLLERGRKVPLADLCRILAPEHAERAFRDLQDLDGVVKLHADPVGLSLTEDLRHELRSIVYFRTGARPTSSAAPSEPPAQPTGVVSPEHKLFGLSETATLEEIKAAYRLRMKQYHPDRYADRGEEWRKWAEEKTKALNAAYEALVAQHENSGAPTV